MQSRSIPLIVLCLVSGLIASSASRGLAQAGPGPTDARLNRLITVESEGLGLAELLVRLSRATGVALSARGEAAQEKAIVQWRGRSLRELLADLAALYDATWDTQSSGGSPEYELYLGAAARNREAALQRETANRIAAGIAEYVRGLSLSQSQVARLPAGSPFRQALMNPQTRLGIELYALLGADQRAKLLSTRRCIIPYDALNAAERDAAGRIMSAVISRLQEAARLHRNNPAVQITVPAQGDLRNGSLRFQLKRAGGATQLQLFLAGFGIPVATVDARQAWLLPAHGDPYDPRHPEPVDPLPSAAISSAALLDGPMMADHLRRIARDSGFSVVADYYRSAAVHAATPPGPGSGSVAALDSLCAPSGYLWWRRGRTLLFRKRDWYAQKLAEPDESYFAGLAQRLPAAESEPGLPDVLRLGRLPAAQASGIAGLIAPLVDESSLDGFRELALILGALPSALSSDSFSADGITISAAALPVRSRVALRDFAAVHDIPAGLAAAPLTVRIARTFRKTSRQTDPPMTEVQVRWNLGPHNGVYYLYLPHGFPDDRRARTRVAAARN